VVRLAGLRRAKTVRCGGVLSASSLASSALRRHQLFCSLLSVLFIWRDSLLAWQEDRAGRLERAKIDGITPRPDFKRLHVMMCRIVFAWCYVQCTKHCTIV